MKHYQELEQTYDLEMGMSESAAETLVQTWRAVNEGPGSTYPPRNVSNTTQTTLEAYARDTFVHAYQQAESSN